jgi:uncharacterized protein
MTGDETRERLSWEVFGAAARELARLVVNDGFGPTSLLAITRGAWPLVGR